MIATDNEHLLMIEPNAQSERPVFDELTVMAERVFRECKPSGIRYRGFHRCICGFISDNQEWNTYKGRQTNSLLVHYVRDHRSEVPESELDKLREECAFLNARGA